MNCPQCKQPASYIDAYDAHFCKSCGIWVESECDDCDCRFCDNRPDNPIESEDE